MSWLVVASREAVSGVFLFTCLALPFVVRV